MARVIILLMLLGLNFTYAGDLFKWARVKANIKKPCQEDWDKTMPRVDKSFLNSLAKYTTLKVDMNVYTVTFEDLDKVCEYPFLFFAASRPPIFSDKEIKNLREYLNRGGFLFAEDLNEGPSGLGTSDEFYRGMKEIMENKVFPKSKMKPIPADHQIYHCYFELPYGWPLSCGTQKLPLGMFNEKDGHLMVIISFAGISQGWDVDESWYTPPHLKKETYKAGINMVIYVLTH